MEQRSVEELQAALNLAQLSVARDDNVATLINAMIVSLITSRLLSPILTSPKSPKPTR